MMLPPGVPPGLWALMVTVKWALVIMVWLIVLGFLIADYRGLVIW